MKDFFCKLAGRLASYNFINELAQFSGILSKGTPLNGYFSFLYKMLKEYL